MKNKIAIFVVFCMMLSQIFASDLFTKIFTSGDSRYIQSILILGSSDFENSNFFMKNINNSYYTDIDVRIFEIIQDDSKNQKGTEERDLNWIPKEIKRKGDFIACFDVEKNEKTIVYGKWNKQKKTFFTYWFNLIIYEDKYKEYESNMRYHEKCIKNIEWCNWVLENCSSPTLKEVDYYNARSTGDYMDATGGGANDVSITYETLNRPKLSSSNPNYDPEKVAEAKRILPKWKQEKTNTEQKLKYFPFRIELLSSTDY